MSISSSRHQFGQPLILVLLRQCSLFAKIAQDYPHGAQAVLCDAAPCSKGDQTFDVVGSRHRLHAPVLVGMKQERH